MHVQPLKVKDPSGGNKKVDDYWIPAQKQLLSDTKFLSNLLEYDKDNIEDAVMTKVQPYCIQPDFQPEKVKKASVAASGLCSWVHAMVVYNRVTKEVGPKREALAEASANLEQAQSDLAVKQHSLESILDKIAVLESDLANALKKKSDLEDQVGFLNIWIIFWIFWYMYIYLYEYSDLSMWIFKNVSIYEYSGIIQAYSSDI